MARITLTPAYGRDYTSKAAVVRDFAAGKDFIFHCFGDRYDGKPVNREQLVELGTVTVSVRYNGLRSTAEVPVGSAS